MNNAMNEKDFMAISKIISDTIVLHMAKFDSQLQIISNNVEHVKEKTIDTIEIVNTHSDQIGELQRTTIEHLVDCPVESRVKKLEITNATKAGMWKFAVILGTVMTTVFTVVVAIFELYLKQKS